MRSRCCADGGARELVRAPQRRSRRAARRAVVDRLCVPCVYESALVGLTVAVGLLNAALLNEFVERAAQQLDFAALGGVAIVTGIPIRPFVDGATLVAARAANAGRQAGAWGAHARGGSRMAAARHGGILGGIVISLAMLAPIIPPDRAGRPLLARIMQRARGAARRWVGPFAKQRALSGTLLADRRAVRGGLGSDGRAHIPPERPGRGVGVGAAGVAVPRDLGRRRSRARAADGGILGDLGERVQSDILARGERTEP